MRIISMSVSPAAASVDAPPIRREWVDMRLESMPKWAAMFLSWSDSCGAFKIQFSDGMAKNGPLAIGRAHVACAHISET